MSDLLKTKRAKLCERLRRITNSKDMFDLQVELSQEIVAMEKIPKRERSEGQAHHLHLLRVIGDAIAWMHLHPHTIRQLAKNLGHSPNISSQGPAFDRVLDAARVIIEKDGVPVLVSDLTNCIRIGDLIIAVDPEAPGIIEVKSSGNTEIPPRGRARRQLLRMQNTFKYLRDGTALFENEEIPRLTIELNLKAKHLWQVIDEVCTLALEKGKAGKALSEGHFIWASSVPDDVMFPEDLFHGQSGRGFVACHLVPIEEAWPSVPPPVVWSVEPKHAQMLLEGDLVVMSLFNPEMLIGFEHDGAKIVKVDWELPGGDHGYLVKIGELELLASAIFSDRILYGFEEPNSVAASICAFGAALARRAA